MKLPLHCRHPIQYHNANSVGSPWRKTILNYLLPVVSISVVTNIPKFMEIKVDKSVVTRVQYDELLDKHVEVITQKALFLSYLGNQTFP